MLTGTTSRARPQGGGPVDESLERRLLDIIDLAGEIRAATRRGEGGFACVAAGQIGKAAREGLRLIGQDRGDGP